MSLINDLVTHYFEEGLTNNEIITFLAKYDDIVVCERTVKRILRKLGRRRICEDPMDVLRLLLKMYYHL